MEDFLFQLSPWLEQTYFNNTVREYLIALGIFLAFIIFSKFLKDKLIHLFNCLAARTKTDVDDEIIKTAQYIPPALYFFAGLYFAIRVIEVHHIITKLVEVGLIIMGTYWMIRVASEMIEYGLYRAARRKGPATREQNSAYFALSLLARIFLWSTGFLLILSNLGVNISALVASLGIGGIAVALAVQNILGDMISSFSIYMDKPFEVGDFIVVGPHMGTVKRIGLKSTRIQALAGEEIVISNNELITARVQNYKRLQKRRVQFELAIKYETATVTLAKIPKMIEKIIKGIELIEFDRTHLVRFAHTGMMYEVVYNLNSADYNQYMDIQQKINFEILKAFEKEKIKMAFPGQNLYLYNQGKAK